MMNRIMLALSHVIWGVVAIGRTAPSYFTDAYRPELHYMRGPGPKWREKHQELPVQTPMPLSSAHARQTRSASAPHDLAAAGLAAR